MLVIEASAPAGTTIEKAIEEALELSKKMNVMVKLDLNDIPLTIVHGLPELDGNFTKEVAYFRDRYDEAAKAK